MTYNHYPHGGGPRLAANRRNQAAPALLHTPTGRASA